MTTYACVHGAGDGGWSWHLVEAELRARGHTTIAPDLPAGDEDATLSDYADVVLDAVADLQDPEDLVVVAHSFGAFTAPLVAARRPVRRLVLVAGMIPSPGEPPSHWWTATGYDGRDLPEDPRTLYYHDVPDELTDQALARERPHPSAAAYDQPWPLRAWPDVPTTFVLGTDDRLFPPAFLRRVVRDRLGVVPLEVPGGHCLALARPRELGELLSVL